MTPNAVSANTTAIIVAIVLIFILYIWYRIFSKAGYNGFLSILMVIPFVNFIMLLYFAFAEWPIQRALREGREKSLSQFDKS